MIAAACWTWYPLRNADWLRDHAGRSARVWSTAQGLAMLPQAALGYGLFWVYADHTQMNFTMPFGPRPTLFIGLMLAIGLLASWAGTLCWNETAKRLPSVIAGQLIVFETLSALAYTFMLRGAWPAPLTALGIALLIAGVIAAARVRPKPLAREP
jgi:drug/metabolite transporter (DMT)-like permease